MTARIHQNREEFQRGGGEFSDWPEYTLSGSATLSYQDAGPEVEEEDPGGDEDAEDGERHIAIQLHADHLSKHQFEGCLEKVYLYEMAFAMRGVMAVT